MIRANGTPASLKASSPAARWGSNRSYKGGKHDEEMRLVSIFTALALCVAFVPAPVLGEEVSGRSDWRP